VRVEVLYFDGCPNHERWMPHLRGLLDSAGVSDPVELVAVETDEAAREQRFLGSPSLRIDGVDIDPGAAERTDFGLKCRLFATGAGLVGVPPDAWVLAAVRAAER
jgi:hypothetical protein